MMSHTDERVQQLNARLFNGMQDLVEDLVHSGQADGSIRSDIDPISIAYWIRGLSYVVNQAVVIGVDSRLPLIKAEENLSKLLDFLKPPAVASKPAPKPKAKASPATKPVAKKAKPKPKSKK